MQCSATVRPRRECLPYEGCFNVFCCVPVSLPGPGEGHQHQRAQHRRERPQGQVRQAHPQEGLQVREQVRQTPEEGYMPHYTLIESHSDYATLSSSHTLKMSHFHTFALPHFCKGEVDNTILNT